jgi:DNA-binding transcriptional regulator LsrR (DeoR family)
MIDFETFLKIKYLHRHYGLKCSQIANQIGLDDRTVDKWLKENHYRPRKRITEEQQAGCIQR